MSDENSTVSNFGGNKLFGGCDCAGRGNNACCDKCCTTHTVLPVDGPPDPSAYCNMIHGSTFQSGAAPCTRYWTKIGSNCTAADYLEIERCMYIGMRRPGTAGVQIIPKGVITPVELTDVRVDTTGTQPTAANGIILPCKGVWTIEARTFIKHPLEPDVPPADPGQLTQQAVISIFIGRNGGYSYSREYSPVQFFPNPLWPYIDTDRTECLDKSDTFTMSVYWEDTGTDEVQELELQSASLTATFVCHCDDTVVNS